MLEFKEVTYLYRLGAPLGRVEDINTTGGYIHIDYNKGLCWPLIAVPGVPTPPWDFLKEGSTLYIMRKEPLFYA